MCRFSWLPAALLAALAARPADAACPDGWLEADGVPSCYKVTVAAMQQWECASACGSNASLACITSRSETDAIKKLAVQHADVAFIHQDRSIREFWMGHYQTPGAAEPAGGWDYCVSGEPVGSYSNWWVNTPSGPQPDNLAWSYTNDNECMVIKTIFNTQVGNGSDAFAKWADYPCSVRRRCLCERGVNGSALEYSAASNQQQGPQASRRAYERWYDLVPRITAAFAVLPPLFWALRSRSLAPARASTATMTAASAGAAPIIPWVSPSSDCMSHGRLRFGSTAECA